jgi:hypothetical protein
VLKEGSDDDLFLGVFRRELLARACHPPLPSASVARGPPRLVSSSPSSSTAPTPSAGPGLDQPPPPFLDSGWIWI